MLYGIKDFAAPALLTFTGSPQAGKQSQLSGQFIGSFGIIYAGALPKKTPQNPGNNCFFNHTKILNKKVIFTDNFLRNYIVHSVKWGTVQLYIIYSTKVVLVRANTLENVEPYLDYLIMLQPLHE